MEGYVEGTTLYIIWLHNPREANRMAAKKKIEKQLPWFKKNIDYLQDECYEIGLVERAFLTLGIRVGETCFPCGNILVGYGTAIKRCFRRW